MTNADGKEILIIGAGSVGAYFGGRLAQQGAKVTVVCRSDYNEVLKNGYNVKSVAGDFHFKPYSVLNSAADYQGKADYVLLATKVLPEINFKNLLEGVLQPDTAVVLMQNGVEIEAPVAEILPEENELISAIIYIGASRPKPGEVLHEGAGFLSIGNFPQGASEKVRDLAEMFHRAKVRCDVVEDIVKLRWQKLVWNAPYNPISVLGGHADTEVIMNNKNSAGLARAVMEEVCAIAKAAGHELDKNVVDENIDFTINFPPYKPSMLQDFENGRPLEVEAILGNAVRAADREGVEVPHLRTMYSLLQLVKL
jgi:2-dehydropantoate 2-reductase